MSNIPGNSVPAPILAKRRRMLLMVAAPVLVVLLIIGGFVAIKANQSPAAATGAPSVPAGATMEASIKSIPAATFDAVGAGMGVKRLAAATGTPLTAAGKPRVLYVGAEFCPYCAAERWAMAAALSRFGTFSRLGLTRSSATDVHPNTATLSFHGATYTSDLLSFTGVELTTNIAKPGGTGYIPLDTLTASDKQTDAALNKKGFIPFVDFGNKHVITGVSYDVSVLQGLNQTQIITAIYDPKSEISQRVLGAANMMTASLCQLTHGQPADVCTASAVTAQKLP